MTPRRKIALKEFLTLEQTQQAAFCKNAKEACDKVITPNMAEIEKKLGQECDAMYLSYATEFMFRQTGVWK